MPFAARLNRLLVLPLMAAMAMAQGSTASSPTTTAAPDSTTSSPDEASTTDVPMHLWSVANGLLTSYYPSTSLTGVATLSWPDTVVIEGTTYNVQSLSDAVATSTPATSLSTHQAVVSTSATPTDPPATQGTKEPHQNGPIGDKRLGIILGCVIGLVVLILVGVLFWCLRRRKSDTGSFFMRRRTPSNASSNVRSWLPSNGADTYGNTAYVSAGAANSDVWEKPQPQVAVRPQMAEPRMSQHPAFAPARLQGSSRSTSEENPFYTPAERMDAQFGHDTDLERGAYDPHPVELDDNGKVRPQSFDELQATGDRPPTPFSPMEMMGFGASRTAPPSQVERRDFGRNPAQGQPHTANPFSSPEDEEPDVVSPILPSKSPERRHSPMVHYPSWSEVSEFDFHGDGRRELRNMSSGDTDGGDGWRPLRERTDGRYELA